MDNEPVVRCVCSAAIQRIGYTPILAVDGEHGLNIFEQELHEIDLVIADVSMPKLDGIENGSEDVRIEAPLERNPNDWICS